MPCLEKFQLIMICICKFTVHYSGKYQLQIMYCMYDFRFDSKSACYAIGCQVHGWHIVVLGHSSDSHSSWPIACSECNGMLEV